ncbi:methyl-accepting chemotaxis protein [Chitinimonas koreensis]|uniref:methyl-accepting chemotaxis protein n=1 Tax=Chitinimonas koreensis TaxID=356302 RepID=UPI00041B62CB|nr:CHASE3 domain-containing protein [Chitinimonas koreensis]QNM97537.1 CHASE3 domain-containing protein [Chitinimonas koreensis]
MQWTVGRKIALGYVLALAALAAIGVTAHRSLSGLLDAAHWKDHTYAVLGDLGKIGGLLKDAETGQRGYLLTGEPAYLAPYEQSVLQLDGTLAALRSRIADNAAQQRRLEALQQAVAGKLAELQQTVALRRDRGLEPALAVVKSDRGKQDMDTIRRLIGEMELDERQLLQQRERAMQHNADFAMQLAGYGIPLATLLVSLVAVLVVRDIAGPLRALAAAADAISSGDLAPGLRDGRRSDELGTLNRAFEQMAAVLRNKAGIASQIARGDLRVQPAPLSERDEFGRAFRTMVENLQRVVQDLRQGSATLGSVVDTVLSGTAQVATAADETATATAQLATTIAELRQTTELTSQRMAEVSGSAHAASDVAQTGQAAVRGLADGMQTIQQRMGAVAERIAELTERSMAISDIVDAVNSLAEQSAILAVNASIEAAHADEQGLGFAVVAQEMKQLAGQSKRAVGQVRTVLAEIQQLISALVGATEQSSRAVAEGMAQSDVAGDALARMAATAAANALAAQQVAVTTLQQATGVQQVAAAVHHIRQGNDDNLASMRAIQHATQDLRQAGERLGGIIEGFAT